MGIEDILGIGDSSSKKRKSASSPERQQFLRAMRTYVPDLDGIPDDDIISSIGETLDSGDQARISAMLGDIRRIPRYSKRADSDISKELTSWGFVPTPQKSTSLRRGNRRAIDQSYDQFFQGDEAGAQRVLANIPLFAQDYETVSLLNKLPPAKPELRPVPAHAQTPFAQPAVIPQLPAATPAKVAKQIGGKGAEAFVEASEQASVPKALREEKSDPVVDFAETVRLTREDKGLPSPLHSLFGLYDLVQRASSIVQPGEIQVLPEVVVEAQRSGLPASQRDIRTAAPDPSIKEAIRGAVLRQYPNAEIDDRALDMVTQRHQAEMLAGDVSRRADISTADARKWEQAREKRMQDIVSFLGYGNRAADPEEIYRNRLTSEERRKGLSKWKKYSQTNIGAIDERIAQLEEQYAAPEMRGGLHFTDQPTDQQRQALAGYEKRVAVRRKIDLLKKARRNLESVRNLSEEDDPFYMDISRSLRENVTDKLIPFLGDVVGLDEAAAVGEAVAKRQRGAPLTDEEQLVFDAAVAKASAEIYSKPGILRKAMDMGVNIPKYATEFGMTGGSVTGIRAGVSNAVKSVIKGAAAHMPASAAKRVAPALVRTFGAKLGTRVAETAGTAVAGAVQSLSNPARIAADAYSRMTDQTTGELSDDMKEIAKYTLERRGDNFVPALLKAVATNAIDYVTEYSGESIMRGFGSMLRPQKQLAREIGDALAKRLGTGWAAKLKPAVLSKYLGARNADDANGIMREIMRAQHWDGTMAEFMEELAAIIPTNIVEGQDITQGLDPENLASILLGVAGYGGAMGTAGAVGARAADVRRQRGIIKDLKRIEKEMPPSPLDVKKASGLYVEPSLRDRFMAQGERPQVEAKEGEDEAGQQPAPVAQPQTPAQAAQEQAQQPVPEQPQPKALYRDGERGDWYTPDDDAVDFNKPQKFTENRANTETPQAPEIPVESVDWDKSFPGARLGEDISRVRLLEMRGRNNQGVPVGTVRAWSKPTPEYPNGISNEYEVFFRQPPAPAQSQTPQAEEKRRPGEVAGAGEMESPSTLPKVESPKTPEPGQMWVIPGFDGNQPVEIVTSRDPSLVQFKLKANAARKEQVLSMGKKAWSVKGAYPAGQEPAVSPDMRPDVKPASPLPAPVTPDMKPKMEKPWTPAPGDRVASVLNGQPVEGTLSMGRDGALWAKLADGQMRRFTKGDSPAEGKWALVGEQQQQEVPSAEAVRSDAGPVSVGGDVGAGGQGQGSADIQLSPEARAVSGDAQQRGEAPVSDQERKDQPQVAAQDRKKAALKALQDMQRERPIAHSPKKVARIATDQNLMSGPNWYSRTVDKLRKAIKVGAEIRFYATDAGKYGGKLHVEIAGKKYDLSKGKVRHSDIEFYLGRKMDMSEPAPSEAQPGKYPDLSVGSGQPKPVPGRSKYLYNVQSRKPTSVDPSKFRVVVAQEGKGGAAWNQASFNGETAEEAYDKAQQWIDEQENLRKQAEAPEPQPAAAGERRARGAKEPWEMMAQESLDWQMDAFGEPRRPMSEAHKGWHWGQVRDALIAGKDVPRRVLEEYRGRSAADEALAKLDKPAQLEKSPVAQPQTPKAEEGPNVAEINRIPLGDIDTDIKRFQMRKTEFSQDTVNSIKANVADGTFRWDIFSPVILWRDPKKPGSRPLILAGHSRVEAFRQLTAEGRTEFAAIPAQILEGVSEAEAIRIAQLSNTLGTKETDFERAAYYSALRRAGKSKAEIAREAQIAEKKNAARVLALSYLNPNGKISQDASVIPEGGKPEDRDTVMKFAHWIGQAREAFPELSDTHENELRDFLVSGSGGKIRSGTEFMSRVQRAIDYAAVEGGLKPDVRLNIENRAIKSADESEHDAAIAAAEKEVLDAEANLRKKRKEYALQVLQKKATQAQMDAAIAKINADLNAKAEALAELRRQAGDVRKNASAQPGLFDEPGEQAPSQGDVRPKPGDGAIVEGGKVRQQPGELTIQDAPPKDKPIVLVYGGSFAPMHAGHAGVAEQSRKLLESAGYTVETVIVAPSADRFLKDKLGDDYLPIEDRIEISKRMFADSTGVTVTAEPAAIAERSPVKQKRTFLADWAQTKYPGATIVSLAGEDSAPGNFPTPPGLYLGDAGTAHEGYYYLVLPRDDESYSSSQIRKLRSGAISIPTDMMPPRAAARYRMADARVRLRLQRLGSAAMAQFEQDRIDAPTVYVAKNSSAAERAAEAESLTKLTEYWREKQKNPVYQQWLDRYYGEDGLYESLSRPGARVRGTAREETSELREELRDLIIDEMIGEVQPVPEGQTPELIVVYGGGKGYYVDQLFSGKEGRTHVTANPDDIKSMLPEAKMLYGARILDGAQILHRESADMNKVLIARLREGRYNVIWDGTGPDAKHIESFRAAGYRIVSLMVDADVPTALQNAYTRFMIKGRFVPDSIVRSANEEARQAWWSEYRRGSFDSFYYVHNTNNVGTVVARDGTIDDQQLFELLEAQSESAKQEDEKPAGNDQGRDRGDDGRSQLRGESRHPQGNREGRGERKAPVSQRRQRQSQVPDVIASDPTLNALLDDLAASLKASSQNIEEPGASYIAEPTQLSEEAARLTLLVVGRLIEMGQTRFEQVAQTTLRLLLARGVDLRAAAPFLVRAYGGQYSAASDELAAQMDDRAAQRSVDLNAIITSLEEADRGAEDDNAGGRIRSLLRRTQASRGRRSAKAGRREPIRGHVRRSIGRRLSSDGTVRPDGRDADESQPRDSQIPKGRGTGVNEDWVLDVNSPVRLTPKQRAETNLAAIRILNDKARAEITNEDRAILAQYTGWGGLNNWLQREEYRNEIESLVGASGLAQMEESTANAHYTDFPVIDMIYRKLGAMGFRGGKTLEIGAGIGHFAGLSPEAYQFDMVEIDQVSARIASILYPQQNVFGVGIEQFARSGYDAHVGNVPFGNFTVPMRKTDPYRKMEPPIHTYCILRGIDALEADGVTAIITSTFFMDGHGSKAVEARKLIDSKAEFIGGYRLPAKTFEANADTSVTTDVLFFRKRHDGEAFEPNTDFIESSQVDLPLDREQGTGKGWVSNYFVKNPQRVMGTMLLGHKVTSVEQIGVKGDFTDATIEKILSDDIRPSHPFRKPGDARAAAQDQNGWLPAPQDMLIGSWTSRGETFYEKNAEGMLQPMSLTKPQRERVDLFVTAIDGMKEVYAGKDDPESTAGVRATIKKAVGDYWEKFGDPREDEVLENLSARNPDVYRFINLRDKKQRYAPVLDTGVVVTAGLEFKKPSASDLPGLAMYLYVTSGKLDFDTLRSLYRDGQLTEDEMRAELDKSPDVYYNPRTNEYETQYTYLSGYVLQKLDDAQEALAAGNESMRKNVSALIEARPPTIVWQQADIDIRNGYISNEILTEWLRDMVLGENSHARDRNTTVSVKTSLDRSMLKGESGSVAAHGFKYIVNAKEVRRWERDNDKRNGLSQVAFSEALYRFLNRKGFRASWPENASEEVIKNAKAIAEQRTKELERLNERFKQWLASNPTHAATVEKEFNLRFNGYKQFDFTGKNVHVPGVSATFYGTPTELYPWHFQILERYLVTGRLINAHDVGSGKTISSILMCALAKQRGLAKKPVVVVPAKTIGKWMQEAQDLFPEMNIVNLGNLPADRRDDLLVQAAYSEADMLLITDSALQRMPLSPAVMQDYLLAEFQNAKNAIAASANMTETEVDAAISDLEEYEESVKAWKAMTKEEQKDNKHLKPKLPGSLADKDQTTVSMIKQAIRVKNSLAQVVLDMQKEAPPIYFDQTGIDMIIADEAHNYKNIFSWQTRPIDVPGKGNAPAQRAQDFYYKAQFIREMNAGRNVVLLTATPATNSPTEIYNMVKLVAPEVWTNQGIWSFDNWLDQYARTEIRLTRTAKQTYEARMVLREFANLPALQQALRSVMDMRSIEELEALRPADQRGKLRPKSERIRVICQPSPELEAYMLALRERAKQLAEDMRYRRKTTDSFRLITNDGRRASIDIRAVGLTQRTNERFDKLIANVVKEYKSGGNQIIFMDNFQFKNGVNLHKEIRDALVKQGIPAAEIDWASSSPSRNSSMEDRKSLQDRFNAGQVRVLMGSTTMIGEGMNLQEDTVAIHEYDSPYKPSSMIQRHGRAVRQGNKNDVVRIYQYMTLRTFDEFVIDKNEQKASWINNVFRTNRTEAAVEDEVTLDYNDIMGQLSRPEIRKLFDARQRAAMRSREMEYFKSVKGQRQKEIEANRNSMAQYKADAETIRSIQASADRIVAGLKELKMDNSLVWSKASKQTVAHLDAKDIQLAVVRNFQLDAKGTTGYLFLLQVSDAGSNSWARGRVLLNITSTSFPDADYAADSKGIASAFKDGIPRILNNFNGRVNGYEDNLEVIRGEIDSRQKSIDAAERELRDIESRIASTWEGLKDAEREITEANIDFASRTTDPTETPEGLPSEAWDRGLAEIAKLGKKFAKEIKDGAEVTARTEGNKAELGYTLLLQREKRQNDDEVQYEERPFKMTIYLNTELSAAVRAKMGDVKLKGDAHVEVAYSRVSEGDRSNTVTTSVRVKLSEVAGAIKMRKLAGKFNRDRLSAGEEEAPDESASIVMEPQEGYIQGVTPDAIAAFAEHHGISDVAGVTESLSMIEAHAELPPYEQLEIFPDAVVRRKQKPLPPSPLRADMYDDPTAWERAFSDGDTVSSVIANLVKFPQSTVIPLHKVKISGPQDVAALLMPLRSPYFETVKVVWVGDDGSADDIRIVSIGALTQSSVDWVSVLGNAPKGKTKFFVSHNHPSGKLKWSSADQLFSEDVHQASSILGYTMLDHILTNGGYLSLAEEGRMWPEKGLGAKAVSQNVPAMEYQAAWERVKRGERVNVGGRTILDLNVGVDNMVGLITALRQSVEPGAGHIVLVDNGMYVSAVARLDLGWMTSESVNRKAQAQAQKLARKIAVLSMQQGARNLCIDLPWAQSSDMEDGAVLEYNLRALNNALKPFKINLFETAFIDKLASAHRNLPRKTGRVEEPAFHGGPRRWMPEDGFPYGRPRLDMVGSGEGITAYGWGWYSAQSMAVARSYQTAGDEWAAYARDVWTDYSKRHPKAANAFRNKWLSQFAGDLSLASSQSPTYFAPYLGTDLIGFLRRGRQDPEFADKLGPRVVDLIDASVADGFTLPEEPERALYEVDIPDDVMDNMIKWDASWSEQPRRVRDAIAHDPLLREVENDMLLEYAPKKGNPEEFWSGESFYARLVDRAERELKARSRKGYSRPSKMDKQRAASEYLASKGILGSIYLDAGSSSTGARMRTYNYVIWHQPTLDRVRVVAANGQRLSVAEANAQYGGRTVQTGNQSLSEPAARYGASEPEYSQKAAQLEMDAYLSKKKKARDILDSDKGDKATRFKASVAMGKQATAMIDRMKMNGQTVALISPDGKKMRIISKGMKSGDKYPWQVVSYDSSAPMGEETYKTWSEAFKSAAVDKGWRIASPKEASDFIAGMDMAFPQWQKNAETGRTEMVDLSAPYIEKAELAGLSAKDMNDPAVIADAKREWLEKGTESKYFKRWFGKSKVVDADGNALRMYRGRRQPGSDIPMGSRIGALGAGVYLTSDSREASDVYAGTEIGYKTVQYPTGSNVSAYYVSLQNPIVGTFAELSRRLGLDFYSVNSRSYLEKRGHDGIVVLNELGEVQWVIAQNPEQVKSATGNRGTFDPNDPSTINEVGEGYGGNRAPVSSSGNQARQQDQQYLDAVKRGDMATAQKMVDAAAERAGYTIGPVYHGSPIPDIEEFQQGRAGAIYFTEDQEYASGHGANEYRVRLKIDRLADLRHPQSDALHDLIDEFNRRGGWSWSKDAMEDRDSADWDETTDQTWELFDAPTLNVGEWLREQKYDGALLEEREGIESYAVTDPAQIKSADAVTYDKQGNVIPLSQRFDRGTPSIIREEEASYGNVGVTTSESAVLRDAAAGYIQEPEPGKAAAVAAMVRKALTVAFAPKTVRDRLILGPENAKAYHETIANNNFSAVRGVLEIENEELDRLLQMTARLPEERRAPIETWWKKHGHKMKPHKALAKLQEFHDAALARAGFIANWVREDENGVLQYGGRQKWGIVGREEVKAEEKAGNVLYEGLVLDDGRIVGEELSDGSRQLYRVMPEDTARKLWDRFNDAFPEAKEYMRDYIRHDSAIERMEVLGQTIPLIPFNRVAMAEFIKEGDPDFEGVEAYVHGLAKDREKSLKLLGGLLRKRTPDVLKHNRGILSATGRRDYNLSRAQTQARLNFLTSELKSEQAGAILALVAKPYSARTEPLPGYEPLNLDGINWKDVRRMFLRTRGLWESKGVPMKELMVGTYMVEKHWQIPTELKRELVGIMGERSNAKATDPTVAMLLEGASKLANGVVNSINATHLIRPGTAMTNYISGELQLMQKTLSDVFYFALSGASADAWIDLKSNFTAIWHRLSPKTRRTFDKAIPKETFERNFWQDLGNTKSEAGVTNKLLIPFQAVEVLFKARVYDMCLFADAERYARSFPKWPSLTTEQRKKVILARVLDPTPEMMARARETSDRFTYDYQNIPRWLIDLKRRTLFRSILPYPTYFYKFASQMVRGLGDVSGVVPNTLRGAAGTVRSEMGLGLLEGKWDVDTAVSRALYRMGYTPTHFRKIANFLATAGLTVGTALLLGGGDDDEDLPIGSLGRFQDMTGQRYSENMADAKFDTSNRFLLWQTNDALYFLRAIKYPWVREGIAIRQMMNGEFDPGNYMGDLISTGSIFDAGLAVMGLSDKYNQYKPIGAQLGERIASDIPLGPILNDAQAFVDATSRKSYDDGKSFFSNLWMGFASKMPGLSMLLQPKYDSQTGQTRQYPRGLSVWNFFTGLRLKEIPKEDKKVRDLFGRIEATIPRKNSPEKEWWYKTLSPEDKEKAVAGWEDIRPDVVAAYNDLQKVRFEVLKQIVRRAREAKLANADVAAVAEQAREYASDQAALYRVEVMRGALAKHGITVGGQ